MHQLQKNTTGVVYNCTALIRVWEVTKVRVKREQREHRARLLFQICLRGKHMNSVYSETFVMRLGFQVIIYGLLLYFYYSCETLAVV